jgi:hypothetical protein
MRLRSTFYSAIAATLMLPLAAISASAQVPASTEIQAQAAAMTLTTDDLPTGFSFTGETFLDLPDAGTVPGATAHYLSLYTNTDTGQQIRSYVFTFENADQASAGFDALEGDEPATLTDAALELGTGNAEISTGTYERVDGTVVGTADATFVRGTAVVGVAVDNPDGTVPDAQLATDLAGLADARATAVSAGESPVDLTLPALLAPITDNGTILQAGYLNASESEAIYGTQGSALGIAQSSYVQTVAYGEDGTAPRVTVGISTFASADEATAVVDLADSIFQPLADQQKVEDVEIDGTDAAVAYRYTSRDGTTAQRESYRVIFAQGETVTVVDVQGADDSELAQAAANAIVSAQVDCQTDGVCERPQADGVIPA